MPSCSIGFCVDEHVERPRQIVALAGDGHVILLHRLQERRLRARAGAVHFVGEQELGEHRPLDETERALAGVAFLQHLGAENVGGHQVRRELDAPRLEPEHGAQRVHELGLRETRHADQQGVAAGQDGDQREIDHLLLPEDHGADRGARRPHVGGGGFGGADDRLIQALEILGGGAHFSLHCPVLFENPGDARTMRGRAPKP